MIAFTRNWRTKGAFIRYQEFCLGGGEPDLGCIQKEIPWVFQREILHFPNFLYETTSNLQIRFLFNCHHL
jgi:hypothetical protein